MKEFTISVVVNGLRYERSVESRLSLADFLRDRLGLTGTHVGCSHGVCGACTVLVNGDSIRSCLMLAAQANEAEVTTVEGLAPSHETFHPLQMALHEKHGVQCGFCTSGILMTLAELVNSGRLYTEAEIREAISGHLCRCTGYQGIVDAALSVVGSISESSHGNAIA